MRAVSGHPAPCAVCQPTPAGGTGGNCFAGLGPRANEAAEIEEPLATPEGAPGPASEPLDVMIQRVCRLFGVDPVDLGSSRRANGLSTARTVIAFLGVARLGVSGAQVAVRVGLSRSGVSRALERGGEICLRAASRLRESSQAGYWGSRYHQGRVRTVSPSILSLPALSVHSELCLGVYRRRGGQLAAPERDRRRARRRLHG